MSYIPKVHMDGPDELVVESGGQITNAGTQAAAIPDRANITGGEAPTEAEFNTLNGDVNAIKAALRGVGIIASS